MSVENLIQNNSILKKDMKAIVFLLQSIENILKIGFFVLVMVGNVNLKQKFVMKSKKNYQVYFNFKIKEFQFRE